MKGKEDDERGMAMKVMEYLDMHKFFSTEYLSLLESKSALISKTMYGELYNYFFDMDGQSLHALTKKSEVFDEMKPELYILTNDSGLDNSVAYCNMSFKVILNCNTLTINLIIYDNPQNPLEVPFIYDLDDPSVSFELSKMLEQDHLDIFFLEAIKGKLYQRNFRQAAFDKGTKGDIMRLIQEYLDTQYSEKQEEYICDFADRLGASDIDYLSITIARRDIETNNISKYLALLDPLYPNIKLANKFCEKVALYIEGYDHDPRELWQIPEVRRFIKALNERFHYWLYFLDKNTGSLSMITLALFSTGKGRKNAYEIDVRAFNEFLHKQMVNLNEVCLCSNGTKEKAENLMRNVYKYYGMI